MMPSQSLSAPSQTSSPGIPGTPSQPPQVVSPSREQTPSPTVQAWLSPGTLSMTSSQSLSSPSQSSGLRVHCAMQPGSQLAASSGGIAASVGSGPSGGGIAASVGSGPSGGGIAASVGSGPSSGGIAASVGSGPSGGEIAASVGGGTAPSSPPAPRSGVGGGPSVGIVPSRAASSSCASAMRSPSVSPSGEVVESGRASVPGLVPSSVGTSPSVCAARTQRLALQTLSAWHSSVTWQAMSSSGAQPAVSRMMPMAAQRPPAKVFTRSSLLGFGLSAVVFSSLSPK